MNISEIERTFVGGIILDPDKLVHVNIKAEDFALDNTRKAFVEIRKLWEEKQPVDLYELSKSGLDVKWLSGLTDIGSPARVKYLSREISTEAKKRRILTKLKKIEKDSEYYDAKTMLSDILDLYNAENKDDIKDSSIQAVVKRYEEFQKENRRRGNIGIDTGFDFFRKKYIYYVPGHVWAIGGYTSVGKSASMIEMIERLPDSAKSCVISTEMTREQIVARILSRKTGFETYVLLSGGLHDQRLEDEDRAKKDLLSKKLDVFEDVYFLDDIVSMLRMKHLQGGLNVAWVDYIQNCKVKGAKNEYQAMGMIAKTMQQTAKELRCTIILFSQVGNAAAKEDSGLLEFKGAGDIAAVADLGIWLTRSPDNKENLLWDFRKNRHGRTGSQVLRFTDGWTRLQEIDSVKNK